ncbi:MAG: hypothetical protein KDE56_01865 [Anaerolineales bacterium]|nr:hypothetical protein [Anaerolineales bacterium]
MTIVHQERGQDDWHRTVCDPTILWLAVGVGVLYNAASKNGRFLGTVAKRPFAN